MEQVIPQKEKLFMIRREKTILKALF